MLKVVKVPKVRMRVARGFAAAVEAVWTHHCAPLKAAEGRTGSVAASLVSSATCWLAHQRAENRKNDDKNPLKNYVKKRAHPPRMCPVMIINNAVRLIIRGLL